MKQKFKYHRDKRTRRLTWITTIVIVALSAAVLLLMDDGYLRAWLIVIVVALLLLCVLSIPRYILVTEDALEIHCVVEMTHIPINDISSVRRVTRQDTGRLTLLLGSYGFFGYYGYYANLRRWETVKVYMTEWSNMVEIEDIYEEKYLVSCREADRLIESVMQAKLTHAGEETAG